MRAEERYAEERLDELLDCALMSYTPEAPANLATKVLATIQASPLLESGRSYRSWLAAGLATAAAITIVFLLMRPGTARTSQHEQVAFTSLRPVPHARIFSARNVPASNHRRGTAHRSERAEYVPSPVSEQEALLLALVTQHPHEALALVAQNHEEVDRQNPEMFDSQPVLEGPPMTYAKPVVSANIDSLTMPAKETKSIDLDSLPMFNK